MQLIEIGKNAVDLCRRSSLVSEADTHDVKTQVEKWIAAIQLRTYRFRAAEVIHDEGSFVGFTPESLAEVRPLTPREARDEFEAVSSRLLQVIELCDEDRSSLENTATLTELSKDKPNSAFVMMWMDKTETELEDIRDAIVETFCRFDIKAIRADDIEHEERITDRMIAEIRSSEFLVADLTGARPNVYYEVGYAHALGKRVILFRKQGTQMHFDLAGYNCPEYENIRDLKFRLTNSLEELTNRHPRPPTAA